MKTNDSVATIDTTAPAAAICTTVMPATEDAVPAANWYALAILTLIYSVHFLDRAMISIIVEPVRAEFHLNDSQIGLLTGLAYGATFALAGIPLGMLIDRVNRVKLLALLVAIWSGMTVLAGMSQSYIQLLLARMGVGGSEAGASPASLALISDLFPPSKRSTAIGCFFLSTGIGALLSIFIGGWVTAHYGWRTAMLIAGAPGLLLAIILILTVREPERGATDNVASVTKSAPSLNDVIQYIGDKAALLHLMAGFALTAGGVASIGTWLPSFLMRFHGFNVKEAGLSFAVAAGIFGAIGSFVGGMLSDKVAKNRPRRRMDLGMTACVVATFVAGAGMFVTNGLLAVALLALATMVAFVVFPAAYGTLLTIVSTNMRGTTSATMQVVSNLVGYGMGPFMVGVLSDFYGGGQSLRYAMLTMLCVCFAGAALNFALSARAYERLLAKGPL